MNPFHNRPDEWELYQPLHGKTMLELGGKINNGLTYKAYFESLGFEHTSVDWDGQHGALNRDLRKPLNLGQFDMVCNVGTTEHVTEQEGVWRNIHEAAAIGSVYIGVTPYHDGLSWWWHGTWYPKEAFYEQFAERNGWAIERLYTNLEPPNTNLYCRMVKTDDRSFSLPDRETIYFNRRRPR